MNRQDRETQFTEQDRRRLIKAAEDIEESDEEKRQCAAPGGREGARSKTPIKPTSSQTRFATDLLQPEKSSTPKAYTLKEWDSDIENEEEKESHAVGVKRLVYGSLCIEPEGEAMEKDRESHRKLKEVLEESNTAIHWSKAQLSHLDLPSKEDDRGKCRL